MNEIEKQIQITYAHHSHVCDDYWIMTSDKVVQVFFSPSHPYNLKEEDIEKLSRCHIEDDCVLIDKSDHPDTTDSIIADGVDRLKYVIEDTLKNHQIMCQALSEATTVEEIAFARYKSWLDSVEVSEKDTDFVDINIGQMLTKGQVGKLQQVCQTAYDKGDKAGYDRAYKSAMTVFGILCKRETGNILEVTDSEVKSRSGRVIKCYDVDKGKTIFRWEKGE